MYESIVDKKVYAIPYIQAAVREFKRSGCLIIELFELFEPFNWMAINMLIENFGLPAFVKSFTS